MGRATGKGRPSRTTSTEMELEIVERYGRGDPVVSIAEEAGVSPGTVYRLLRIHGGEPNRKPHRRSR